MLSKLFFRLLILFFIVVLSGCNDDSSDSSPANNELSSFNRSNAEIVMALMIAQTERFLGLGQAVVDAANILLDNGGMSTSEDCQGGGSVAVSYTDNDNSLSLSTGDTLHISYTQCVLSPTGELAQGNIDAEITQMNPPTPDVSTFSANLNFGDSFALGSNGEISVQGVFAIQYGSNYIAAEMLFGQEVTFTVQGVDEVYSYFEVSQSKEFAPDYEVEVEIQGDSGTFGTGFSCSYQDDVLTGTIGSAPSSGDVFCVADDESAIKAVASSSELKLDAAGDGTFEYSESTTVFNDATNGYLFGDSPY